MLAIWSVVGVKGARRVAAVRVEILELVLVFVGAGRWVTGRGSWVLSSTSTRVQLTGTYMCMPLLFARKRSCDAAYTYTRTRHPRRQSLATILASQPVPEYTSRYYIYVHTHFVRTPMIYT